MKLEELCDWARSLDPLDLAGDEIPEIPERIAWPVWLCRSCMDWHPIDAVLSGCRDMHPLGGQGAKDPRIVWPDSDLWLALHA